MVNPLERYTKASQIDFGFAALCCTVLCSNFAWQAHNITCFLACDIFHFHSNLYDIDHLPGILILILL